MKHALLTAAIALAAVLHARAQDAVQSVEARLAALDGDWVTSGCTSRADLTAVAAGQELIARWTDATGLSEVDLIVRINWRQHAGMTCEVFFNGESLGLLDQPQIQFPCEEARSYLTVHRFALSGSLYRANGLNEFMLRKTGDEGAVGVCDRNEGDFALSFEVRPVPQPREEQRDQSAVASIRDFSGTWELRDGDLFADRPGQVLEYEFLDRTGYAAVELFIEINFRHLKGRTPEVSMNGILLGRLEQPPEALEARDEVFYPIISHLRVPAEAYRAGGLNRLALTFADENGGAAAICEAAGSGVAMRLTIQEGRASETAQPPVTAPMIPQGIVLVDITTGIVLAPGVIIQSPDLRIMAILTDADGDYSAIEVEIRRVDAGFRGQAFVQSLPVPSGGQVIVVLPPLGPGIWMIQVRAVDQRGSTSDWVPLSTAIEVKETAVGGAGAVTQYAGVDRATLVKPVDFGDQAARSGGSSSGGACSAGAAAGRGALLILAAMVLLIGVVRRIP